MASTYLTSAFGTIWHACFFLAGIISAMLWSVGCLQLYLYSEKYGKTDKLLLKIYVSLTWTLDTVHQFLLTVSLYIAFVKHYGDPLDTTKTKVNALAIASTAAILDAMIQYFFVLRVWHLSNRNRILTGALAIIVLAQLAISVAFIAVISKLALARSGKDKATNIGRSIFAISIFTDLFVAVTLIHLLWKLRSGIKKTDSVLTSIISYTIGTGLVTGLLSAVALIGAVVLPTTPIFESTVYVLPKLYFNCMLASLNARSHLQGKFATDGILSIHLDDVLSHFEAATPSCIVVTSHEPNESGLPVSETCHDAESQKNCKCDSSEKNKGVGTVNDTSMTTVNTKPSV